MAIPNLELSEPFMMTDLGLVEISMFAAQTVAAKPRKAPMSCSPGPPPVLGEPGQCRSSWSAPASHVFADWADGRLGG